MKTGFRYFCALVLGVFALGRMAHAAPDPVLVGFDGAYSLKNSTSAQAIELGLKAAIHEINAAGGVLGGRLIELVTKDNRSVPARGIANLEDFAAIPELVAVFAGRFSPVILQQLEHTHKLKMPLLDVWGAADGITDHDFDPSFTFRVSLKDSWAMPAMLEQAKNKNIRKIGVLLPNSGWGRSNDNALAVALSRAPGIEVMDPIWYNWGEGDMLQYYQSLLDAGAEAVLLVAIDIEAALLVHQLSDAPDVPRVPIISHWGVTGGDMIRASGPGLMKLDFSVVQTFSFLKAMPGPLATFQKTLGELTGSDDVVTLKSPVGVGQAYDMMHLLAMAINKANSTDRTAIRDALENLDVYHGLVRTYEPAFTAQNHDALSPEQVFFTKYRADGVLVPISQ
ncbi:ABC transporter substrate-binding protein [Thalassospira alkalitolerans]|uniref:ABC transporter substrate-binding protein n=1 Tax=Thalassospira alkalitolerans TaxID=1293890 RepID=UPI003AA85C45